MLSIIYGRRAVTLDNNIVKENLASMSAFQKAGIPGQYVVELVCFCPSVLCIPLTVVCRCPLCSGFLCVNLYILILTIPTDGSFPKAALAMVSTRGGPHQGQRHQAVYLATSRR